VRPGCPGDPRALSAPRLMPSHPQRTAASAADDQARHRASMERLVQRNGLDLPTDVLRIARAAGVELPAEPPGLPEGVHWVEASPPSRSGPPGHWAGLADQLRSRPGCWVALGPRSHSVTKALRRLGLEATERLGAEPHRPLIFARARPESPSLLT
ncbi:MAG TPA: hypothetical protein VIY28_14450, partial [Pseudonocardiaceae bacterium]